MSRNERIKEVLRGVCDSCQVSGCKGYPEQECKEFDSKVASTTFLKKM